MSILRALFRSIGIRFVGHIALAVLSRDKLPYGTQRVIGDTSGIGPHIGDETHGAFVAQLDAFIELLRELHGSPRLKTQLSRRLLLQLAGDERRRRITAALLFLDFADYP